LLSLSEEIIGNSILFFKGVLEDSNIWISEMIEFDPTYEFPKDQNG
jgi:hypothetical protein